MSIPEMNTDTDYVHTHVINYEPTYLALCDAVESYLASDDGIAEYRDDLRAAVESDYAAMGLDLEDLTDDVDYSAMIEWEAN